MRDKGFAVTWIQSVHSMIYTKLAKPKPATHSIVLLHTHTHTHTHTHASTHTHAHTQTHTHTHTSYSCTSVGWSTAGSLICDGCWTCCCFLLNSTYWKETMNWVSSWVSVTDSSHMQFGTATVYFMTKHFCTASKMWQAACIRCVIRMLYNNSGLIGRIAFLPTFRNAQ